jgi:myosin heavy subunit
MNVPHFAGLRSTTSRRQNSKLSDLVQIINQQANEVENLSRQLSEEKARKNQRYDGGEVDLNDGIDSLYTLHIMRHAETTIDKLNLDHQTKLKDILQDQTRTQHNHSTQMLKSVNLCKSIAQENEDLKKECRDLRRQCREYRDENMSLQTQLLLSHAKVQEKLAALETAQKGFHGDTAPPTRSSPVLDIEMLDVLKTKIKMLSVDAGTQTEPWIRSREDAINAGWKISANPAQQKQPHMYQTQKDSPIMKDREAVACVRREYSEVLQEKDRVIAGLKEQCRRLQAMMDCIEEKQSPLAALIGTYDGKNGLKASVSGSSDSYSMSRDNVEFGTDTSADITMSRVFRNVDRDHNTDPAIQFSAHMPTE